MQKPQRDLDFMEGIIAIEDRRTLCAGSRIVVSKQVLIKSHGELIMFNKYNQTCTSENVNKRLPIVRWLALQVFRVVFRKPLSIVFKRPQQGLITVTMTRC